MAHRQGQDARGASHGLPAVLLYFTSRVKFRSYRCTSTSHDTGGPQAYHESAWMDMAMVTMGARVAFIIPTLSLTATGIFAFVCASSIIECTVSCAVRLEAWK